LSSWQKWVFKKYISPRSFLEFQIKLHDQIYQMMQTFAFYER